MRLPAKLGLVCALGAFALIASADCGGDSKPKARNGGAGGEAGDSGDSGGGGGSGSGGGSGGSGGSSSSSGGSGGRSGGSGGSSSSSGGGGGSSSSSGGTGGTLSCSGAGGAPASTRKPGTRDKTECKGDALKHCDAGDGLCVEMLKLDAPEDLYCLSPAVCGPCPNGDMVVGECDTVDTDANSCYRTLFFEPKYDANTAGGQCANGFVPWQ